MAPMTRTRANPDRTPNQLMRLYYEQRASAGLIVTECTAVRDDSAGIINAPGIYSGEQIAGWRNITAAVHDKGGKPPWVLIIVVLLLLSAGAAVAVMMLMK